MLPPPPFRGDGTPPILPWPSFKEKVPIALTSRAESCASLGKHVGRNLKKDASMEDLTQLLLNPSSAPTSSLRRAKHGPSSEAFSLLLVTSHRFTFCKLANPFTG